MVSSNLIQYLGIIIGALVSDAVPFGAILVYLTVYAINILTYVYFRFVCLQWAELDIALVPFRAPRQEDSWRGAGVRIGGLNSPSNQNSGNS